MREHPDLFDDVPGPARKARDEALKRVAKNAGSAWVREALELIRLHVFEGTRTGEVIRLRLRDEGLPAPHHHNAWGSLINTAVRRKLLIKAGWGQMRSKRSHARATPIYRHPLG